MIGKTKKLATIGMLCALAFVVMVVGRIPIVLFLKYDPKDVIIAIGGMIYGPLTSLVISIIVSFIEMMTVSDTGLWGVLMNVLSSCAFACTASFIYKKRRKLSGAIIGLSVGAVMMVGVMMLWNYLIAPIYMGYPREEVVKLLLPAFLPFNLLKSTLNAAITMLLYKPVVNILRRTQLIEPASDKQNSKINIGLVVVALVIIATCVLLALVLKGVI